jgi:hypothetical protein
VASKAMLRPVAAVAEARRVDGPREAVGPKPATSDLSAASPRPAAVFRCRRLGPSSRSECWGAPDAARHV